MDDEAEVGAATDEGASFVGLDGECQLFTFYLCQGGGGLYLSAFG